MVVYIHLASCYFTHVLNFHLLFITLFLLKDLHLIFLYVNHVILLSANIMTPQRVLYYQRGSSPFIAVVRPVASVSFCSLSRTQKDASKFVDAENIFRGHSCRVINWTVILQISCRLTGFLVYDKIGMIH